MTRTRIAIAGVGLIGSAHLERARNSTTVVPCAIVDPSPAARELADRFAVPHFATLDELLSARVAEGVVLATPNALHVEQALACTAAGLPVLLEKPVAHSLDEGERLVRILRERGVPVLVGHHRAHSPIMARAKEIIDAGTIGRVVAIQGSAMFYKPDDYFAVAPWRTQAGGGPILLNMIHEVHNLRILCGEIRAVQAYASNALRGHAVEDTVAISLAFASGALGSFILSDTAAAARNWEQTSQENKAYPTYADEDCYVIAGTMGSLSIPTMRLKTYPDEASRSWWKPYDVSVAPLQRADPLTVQMEHFGAVVRGESQPRVTVEDGLANLRVTEAIVEAARTGRSVAIA